MKLIKEKIPVSKEDYMQSISVETIFYDLKLPNNSFKQLYVVLDDLFVQTNELGIFFFLKTSKNGMIKLSKWLNRNFGNDEIFFDFME